MRVKGGTEVGPAVAELCLTIQNPTISPLSGDKEKAMIERHSISKSTPTQSLSGRADKLVCRCTDVIASMWCCPLSLGWVVFQL